MIEFESVTKRYRDGTTAVRDLSLRIPSDQITVLVGPSGCGKTTSLRMINRMLEPTGGRIVWDGRPIKSRRRTKLRRQMGYVIQSGGLFPHRTVTENISTVPGLLHWKKRRTRARAQELMEMVGLEPRLGDRYPAQLSGGQQQRVGVARALAADPIVLLMDEPFSAVDPVVRADLHEQFLGLQQQIGKTIVMITHDIDEAINLGDQVAILRVGGQLAQAGTPQQLLDEPADDFVEGFVGKDRGYRGLSFVAASGLQLDTVQAVRDPASAAGQDPVLVIDSDAQPVGWTDRSRPGHVLDLGTSFDPRADTMRAALDAALTSPVGLAVAVAENGRYLGVATAAEILEQVRSVRASIADAISERATYETGASAGNAEPGTEADDTEQPPDTLEKHDGPQIREDEPAEPRQDLGSDEEATANTAAAREMPGSAVQTGNSDEVSGDAPPTEQQESAAGQERAKQERAKQETAQARSEFVEVGDSSAPAPPATLDHEDDTNSSRDEQDRPVPADGQILDGQASREVSSASWSPEAFNGESRPAQMTATDRGVDADTEVTNR